MGRGVDWAVQDVAQLRQWLVDGRKPREMRALRPDWSLESIKTKIKQLRRAGVRRITSAEKAADGGSLGRDRTSRGLRARQT